ncbi:MAG: 23S rRNA (guanosine(2251)-2'-O)-methyltransferase RlmB [Oscillospiraceae bacterium]|nr:23S rRNA (guanosine(2251)-2'-O)-methyltransferase RlmB [Oscillospiraceae bacterium]
METTKGLENEQLEGRNAVIEALRAGRPIDKIFMADAASDRSLGFLYTVAKEKGIAIVEVDRRKLDAMSLTHAHQGIIAVCAVQDYCTVRDILDEAARRQEEPFVVVCDEITDGHNLGAIIRSAECVGAHGVIIPKRRSAGITTIVNKASAGAAAHLPVARVPNLRAALNELKDAGLWIYGTAADGASPLWETKLTGPIALVIGSEGDGMSRLVRESCDFILSLPMKGKISSLNASVAGAVVMYEILRQRSL